MEETIKKPYFVGYKNYKLYDLYLNIFFVF
jgi:hypothetical protein